MKPSLLTDDTILYINNSKKLEKYWKDEHKFSKVAQYKINIQKLVYFKYTMTIWKWYENNSIYNSIQKNNIPKI